MGTGETRRQPRRAGAGHHSGRPPALGAVGLVLGILGILAGLAAAGLTTGGHGLLAAMVLLAIPAALLGIRYPLAVFWIWLIFVPFLTETDGGLARRAFWVVHRGLPLLAVLAIALERLIKSKGRRLSFGWIEWSMLAFVVSTYVSILYTSADPSQSTIILYDRIVVPMLLFYLVKTSGMLNNRLERLVPAATWIVLTQSLIGILSWAAPGVLPSPWVGRAGERTVGSLQLPGTYSTAILFGVVILVHHALSGTGSAQRRIFNMTVATLGFFMVFLTFSRASWLAGVITVLGLIWLYPKKMLKVIAFAAPIMMLVVGAGLLVDQPDYAQRRFGTTQTASSRLPVMYAAVQMWEAKPLFGFGYGNFELYDRQYQRPVNGFVPEDDHASHHVYLTILAEQGAVGLSLFIAPVLMALFATKKAWKELAPNGFEGRKLVAVLWVVIGCHVTVNNFANMKSSFGLGMWWVTLGLISMLVLHSDGATDATAGDRTDQLARTQVSVNG